MSQFMINIKPDGDYKYNPLHNSVLNILIAISYLCTQTLSHNISKALLEHNNTSFILKCLNNVAIALMQVINLSEIHFSNYRDFYSKFYNTMHILYQLLIALSIISSIELFTWFILNYTRIFYE